MKNVVRRSSGRLGAWVEAASDRVFSIVASYFAGRTAGIVMKRMTVIGYQLSALGKSLGDGFAEGRQPFSESRYSQIFPGFKMPRGSNARFTCFMRSRAGPCSSAA